MLILSYFVKWGGTCSRLHICLASYCWWEKVCCAVHCLGSSSVCLFISLVPLYSSYPFSNEAKLFFAAHLSDLILLMRKSVSSCLLCPASRLGSCLLCVSHHFSCQQNNCHRQSTTVCCIILSLRKCKWSQVSSSVRVFLLCFLSYQCKSLQDPDASTVVSRSYVKVVSQSVYHAILHKVSLQMSRFCLLAAFHFLEANLFAPVCSSY